jgi:hypothetical protein
MTQSADSTDLSEFIRQNRELLTRILAYGDTEAQGYALAAVANAATVEDIERIEEKLEKIKRDVRE